MDKVLEFLKEKWWLALAVAAVAILMLIPAQVGLPGDDYKGCDNDDSKYKSYCQYSKIKSVTEESDGSMTMTVPVDDGATDLTFHLLKFNAGYSVGNTVLVNVVPQDKRAYLFIGQDSNLLWRFITSSGAISYGSSATIDLTTMKQIEESSSSSISNVEESRDYYESKGYECTDDCSGHDAGYEWAEENDVCDADYDTGSSESFNEGVRVYAEESC